MQMSSSILKWNRLAWIPARVPTFCKNEEAWWKTILYQKYQELQLHRYTRKVEAASGCLSSKQGYNQTCHRVYNLRAAIPKHFTTIQIKTGTFDKVRVIIFLYFIVLHSSYIFNCIQYHLHVRCISSIPFICLDKKHRSISKSVLWGGQLRSILNHYD